MELDAPVRSEPVPTIVAGGGAEKRSEASSRLFFLAKVSAVLIVSATVATVALLSYRVSQHQSANAVLIRDVLSVAQALDRFDGDEVLDLTIRGPGEIPGLPGVPISDGITLFLRRGWNGETYVRAVHEEGTITYRYDGQSLYAEGE